MANGKITIIVSALILPAVAFGVGLGLVLFPLIQGVSASLAFRDWFPLIAVPISAFGTALAGLWLYNHQRSHTRANVLKSLYAEVYDRAARCRKDAETWRDRFTVKKVRPNDTGKFRPVEPVLYPSLAAHFGTLPDAVISSTVLFYFRLDAIRRDIDLLVQQERQLTVSDLDSMYRRYEHALPAAVTCLKALRQEIEARTDLSTFDRELQNAHEDFLNGEDILDALQIEIRKSRT